MSYLTEGEQEQKIVGTYIKNSAVMVTDKYAEGETVDFEAEVLNLSREKSEELIFAAAEYVNNALVNIVIKKDSALLFH